MISMKQAVETAKRAAGEILGETVTGLDEIERQSYPTGEVWSITLSLPPKTFETHFVSMTGPVQYKRFLIDVETGELVAMKMREVA